MWGVEFQGGGGEELPMNTMKRCGFPSAVSASASASAASLSTGAAASSASVRLGAALLSLSFVAVGSRSCFRFRFFECCSGASGSVFSASSDPGCSSGLVVEEAWASVCGNFLLRAAFRLASAPPPRSRNVGSEGMAVGVSDGRLGFRLFDLGTGVWPHSVSVLDVDLGWL